MCISVIIPCYNKESTILKTLESIINQTIFKELEVIIIDDCSTDNSYEIIKKLILGYNNIKLIRHNKNKSVFVARQTGIKHSTKEFIGFIDADDWVGPSYFEEMKQYCLKGIDVVENISVIRCFSEYEIKDAYDLYFKHHSEGIIEINPKNKIFSDILVKDWNLLWNKCIRKSRLNIITQLPEYYINFMEDIIIVWLVYMNSKHICVINTESPYYYNVADDTEHLSNITNKEKQQQYVKQVFIIIAAYIANNNKIDWLDIWNKYKNHYIKSFTVNSEELFGIEKFKYKNNIERFLEIMMDNYS